MWGFPYEKKLDQREPASIHSQRKSYRPLQTGSAPACSASAATPSTRTYGMRQTQDKPPGKSPPAMSMPWPHSSKALAGNAFTASIWAVGSATRGYHSNASSPGSRLRVPAVWLVPARRRNRQPNATSTEAPATTMRQLVARPIPHALGPLSERHSRHNTKCPYQLAQPTPEPSQPGRSLRPNGRKERNHASYPARPEYYVILLFILEGQGTLDSPRSP